MRLPRLHLVCRALIDVKAFEISCSRLEAPLKENSIRRAVREGRAALGTGIKEFAARGIPRIIESSGFDYCNIDLEHGAYDMETLADLAAWFAATDVSPIARIHKSFMHMIPGI